MGRYLAERGVNYVDEPGNCHIVLGGDHVAVIEGRRPPRREARGRGMGVAGYRILFAILARPELLEAPVRVLAGEAGERVGSASLDKWLKPVWEAAD